ncbi:hypothetical protein GCM10012279_41700 [Micromonospora yangpuensis]|nr:hypothetical protein GCM10012279_41700 [Micromonospora yangpuensis]
MPALLSPLSPLLQAVALTASPSTPAITKAWRGLAKTAMPSSFLAGAQVKGAPVRWASTHVSAFISPGPPLGGHDRVTIRKPGHHVVGTLPRG